jgi:hypothetical protein
MLKAIVFSGLVGMALVANGAVTPASGTVKPRLKASVTKVSRAATPRVADVVYDELSPEQLAVSAKVTTGQTPCELGTQVNITHHPRATGRFVLELGRAKYEMEPVPTTTGAVRLEDAKSGAVWLQLANKSMLMNQKQGKRMADACMNADQTRVAQEMERTPGPGLLEQK